MQAIDGFTATRSLAMGAALSAVNPKNLLLTVGAATAIAQTGIDAGEQAVAMAVFIVVGTLGPGDPRRHLLPDGAAGDRACSTS